MRSGSASPCGLPSGRRRTGSAADGGIRSKGTKNLPNPEHRSARRGVRPAGAINAMDRYVGAAAPPGGRMSGENSGRAAWRIRSGVLPLRNDPRTNAYETPKSDLCRRPGGAGCSVARGGAADGLSDPADGLRGAPAQRHDAVGHPGRLSAAQGEVRLFVRPDRTHHAGLPDDFVRPAALCRAACRPPSAALFACRGHVLHAGGAAVARRGSGVCVDPPVGQPDRMGVVGLPSRVVACGPTGFGRPQGVGAVDLPGRRECRQCAGPAAGRPGGDPLRTALDRMVRSGRRCGHRHPAAGRRVVPRPAANGLGAALSRSFGCRERPFAAADPPRRC